MRVVPPVLVAAAALLCSAACSMTGNLDDLTRENSDPQGGGAQGGTGGQTSAGKAGAGTSGKAGAGASGKAGAGASGKAGQGGNAAANGGSSGTGGSAGTSGASGGQSGKGGNAGTAGKAGTGGTGGATGCQTKCNDDNACTDDACTGGKCVFTPISLDDDNPCTDDTCNPKFGVQHLPISGCLFCTTNQNCSNGNLCDGVETCSSGKCFPGTPLDTNDNNNCTVDSCSGNGDISHTPVPVDDGNACTVDACDPGTGSITHTMAPSMTACGACPSGYYANSLIADGCGQNIASLVCFVACSDTFASCGGCPEGWHYTSLASAGQCDNQVQAQCVKNNGPFSTCFACPNNWHVVAQFCDNNCLDCQLGTSGVSCDVNSTQFLQCAGYACPTGYQMGGMGSLPGCLGGGNNAVVCVKT